MSEKFRERLGYLSDEIEEGSHLGSVSPHMRESSTGRRSPRRVSRSPRSSHSNTEKAQASTSVNRDSRPEIAAWPAPPVTSGMKPVAKTNPVRPTASVASTDYNEESSNFSEDSAKLFAMLKVAAASSAGRGRESELRRKIQTLEETVAEYERQKYSVMGTFTEYRERVAERERKLEAEYSNKIIALSEEVLSAKKDFEARMKSFQALQEKFEREKEQALEKMRQEHQKEIQVLEQRFSASQLINLEQKYIIEIQRLEEERKSLKSEKERLGETFEMKLRRAQSLYETELTASKMLYSKELEALRDHEEALKEELAARQEEFHDRLQELEHQAQHSKDEMNGCQKDVTVLEKKLKSKEDEIKKISKDLSFASAETQKAVKRLGNVTEDYDKMKEDFKQQQEELQNKIQMLAVAESAKSKLETTIKELQTEVKALKNKVEFLEKERENLQSQSESQTQLQNSQVKALEAVLESLTKEKDSTKEHYEKLLEREREQAEEREYSMKKEFSSKLNEIEEQYNSLREHLEASETFGPENVKLWEEIESLRSEKTSLEEEVGVLRNQLKTKPESNNQNNKISLDYVIELLRAIESVKTKMSQVSNQSSTIKNKSENLNEFEDSVLDVDVALVKDQLRQELSGETETRGPELETILQRLQDLEVSLNTIIEEKDGALEKVEKLQSENEEMLAKLKAFEKVQVSSEGGKEESDVLQKTIEEQEKTLAEQQKLLNLQNDEITKYKSQLEESSKANVNFEESQAASTEEINALKEELEKLNETKIRVQAELKSRKAELQKISKKTEDYVRQRDQKQVLIYEKKIEQLKEEHEKTLTDIRNDKQELEQKIETLLQELEEKNVKKDTVENGIQAEWEEEEEKKEDDEESEKLKQLVEELRNALTSKDEEIANLQESIKIHEENDNCCELVVEDKKTLRSQSVAVPSSTDHYHKNMFQTLVSQMTDKKEKKDAKLVAAEAKKAEKKKEKEREKEQKELKKNTVIANRAKSPSLLTRLRDRSPSKTKFLSPEPTSPTGPSKNLLSPADAERIVEEKPRRTSPSRPPLFSRKPKEGSVPSDKVPNDKSEKRPAWKF